MLSKLMSYLDNNPEANSFTLCETFGLSRGMCERLLCQLEDLGFLAVEKSGGCSGGCSTGGCSTGGCSTTGPAAAINALASAARAQKQPA